MDKTTLSLPLVGVESQHCASRVEEALRAIPTISDVVVKFPEGTAIVTTTTPQESLRATVKAIRSAGYDVAMEHHEFSTQGINCAGCVGSATKVLNKLPGVVEITMDPARMYALITTITGTSTPSELREALRPLGFGLIPQAA